ncbi:MAG: SAVED domain-containing protein [Eubacterium sp.]|nr:SAVED domain-containing protein [Eubacterium sp.]
MKMLKKIPNCIYVFILILLLIVDALGLGDEEFIKKIKFAQVSEAYDTLIAFWPSLKSISEQYIAIFILATIIVLTAFFLKLFYRERLYVMAHFSFEEAGCGLGKETKKKYWIKTVTLNQSSCFVDGVPEKRIISEIDEKIRCLQHEARGRKMGYYGVTHIPFAFLAGYDLGDQSKIHVFHRKRHNSEMFEELSDGANYDLRFDEDEKQKTKKSNELIVAISTSIKITEDEIKRSFGKDKHIVSLSLNNPGYDQLDKYESVERAAREAWDCIRKYSKEYDIRIIHLLIASSVCFAFYIGRNCSAQIDPQIIVYHYQNGQYTWGISVNGDNSKKQIIELKDSRAEEKV